MSLEFINLFNLETRLFEKDEILDILERHYHGRNFIEHGCANDIMSLIHKHYPERLMYGGDDEDDGSDESEY